MKRVFILVFIFFFSFCVYSGEAIHSEEGVYFKGLSGSTDMSKYLKVRPGTTLNQIRSFLNRYTSNGSLSLSPSDIKRVEKKFSPVSVSRTRVLSPAEKERRRVEQEKMRRREARRAARYPGIFYLGGGFKHYIIDPQLYQGYLFQIDGQNAYIDCDPYNLTPNTFFIKVGGVNQKGFSAGFEGHIGISKETEIDLSGGYYKEGVHVGRITVPLMISKSVVVGGFASFNKAIRIGKVLNVNLGGNGGFLVADFEVSSTTTIDGVDVLINDRNGGAYKLNHNRINVASLKAGISKHIKNIEIFADYQFDFGSGSPVFDKGFSVSAIYLFE